MSEQPKTDPAIEHLGLHLDEAREIFGRFNSAKKGATRIVIFNDDPVAKLVAAKARRKAAKAKQMAAFERKVADILDKQLTARTGFANPRLIVVDDQGEAEERP